MSKPTTVDDVVLSGFTDARDMMYGVFGTNSISVLADYAKVLAAMRMQPKQIIDQVAQPVILRMFAAVGADPKTPEGRAAMLPFVDNIALAVQDAHHVILGQMEQSEKNLHALQTGRPHLLKG